MQIRPYIREVQLTSDQAPDKRRYPFSIPAIAGLDRLPLHEAVTFLIGENGMGKSTLLEGIAVAYGFCPEGGGRNFRLETRATHSELYRYLHLVKGPLAPRDGYFLRAESFYNVATYIDDLDGYPAAAPLLREAYGGKSLHEQSHGESFWALMDNRFGPQGVYLLDEPEAALSAGRQMAMLTRIHQLVRQGCQFVISTHSPILLAYPQAWIYQLDDQGIRRVTYDEAAPVQITRRFLEQPERMMERLLGEQED